MNRLRLVALGLALALAIPLVAAQQGAYYDVDGVSYYYAVGHPATVDATWNRDGQQVPADFMGCTWAKTRPDKGLGRVNTIGLLHGREFASDFTNLFGGEGAAGGIVRNTVIDGDFHGDGAQHPAVRATMAAWGNVTVRVDDLNFFDPATGRSTFAGEWFVTEEGYHSPAGPATAGAKPADLSRTAASEDGDWEMHLRIRSLPGAAQQEDHVDEITRPEGLVPWFAPDEGYREAFVFRNVRFGGEGQLEVAASSLAAPGDNDLDVILYAPNGTVLFEEGLTPSILGSAQAGFDFPLDALGDYIVEIQGQLSASQYSLTFTQQTPATFDLNLVWEEIVPGYAGIQEKSACEAIVRADSVTGLVPPRPVPPQFQWLVTTLTLLASLTTVVVATSLVVATRATAKLRSRVADRR